MTFHSEHRPIEAYARAVERAGFVIEAIREPMPDQAAVEALPREERWRRVPNFLMVRARWEGT
jgi:RimJ/RimL family protein N-acetyltransferase